jgi:hypothetical protein
MHWQCKNKKVKCTNRNEIMLIDVRNVELKQKLSPLDLPAGFWQVKLC